MNAAETIQAAIDKLTRLRAEASPGPWAAWKKPMSTLYRTDLVKYGLEDARGVDLFEAQSPENAQLFETLHATIDAQLAILDNALETYRGVFADTQRGSRWADDEPAIHFGDPEAADRGACYHVRRELDLARAILGEQASDD